MARPCAAGSARARGAESHAAEFVRRAQLAAELAARTLEPTEPLRAGSGGTLALSLYREAAHWALRAHAAQVDARGLAAAFDAVPRELLIAAAGGEDALAALRARLETSFVDAAAEPPANVERTARAAAAFVGALLSRAVDRHQQTELVLLERWLRTGIVLLTVGAVASVGGAMIHSALLGPDLATDRPWTTSSAGGPCDPRRRRCGSKQTWIFFHTKRERNPWYQVDLGARRAFSRVEIVNRRECCKDKAVPLVLEVGNDGKSWKQIARRTEEFGEWIAVFPRQTARYVRLRVDRKSTLHLERVSVRTD